MRIPMKTSCVVGGGGSGRGGGRKQLVPEAMPSAGEPPRKQRVKKMEIVVKSAQRIAHPEEVPLEKISDDFRYFARLKVEPTLKIAALRSKLKKYKWAPKENILIVSEDGKVHLNGDSSTLADWGVEENDTLLVCGEDGEFTFYVYSNMDMRKFPVSIHSCFNSIGDVKEKICELKGHSREVQVLTRSIHSAHLQNDIPLVALGIVKPYMKEMEREVPLLKLVGPVGKREKYLKGPVIRNRSIPRC